MISHQYNLSDVDIRHWNEFFRKCIITKDNFNVEDIMWRIVENIKVSFRK